METTTTAIALVTSTLPSPTATATSLSSDFNFGLSIVDVFYITVLYVWYMFLFMACLAVVCGGIGLVCMAVVYVFQYLAKHGRGIYTTSKERMEQYWESSKERYSARHNAPRVRNQDNDSPISDFQESEMRTRFGRETV
ncbi:hypothetical protein EG329_009529 [Mollisiaceae sp. DMI_Dod_QoI]|nr:hypothetical protein EG329_009529 [Helotiales sp. DMI_Dod_QoI]